MSNYQLYRTNIKLGGQMKWDIILRSGGEELLVDDFRLTPVSDNVPCDRSSKKDLLNYSHLENIKSYYKKLEGSFYKDYASPEIVSLEPYIISHTSGMKGYYSPQNKSKIMDNHDSTLEYGFRRVNYAVYNNQFSFFAPIWLSSYDPDKNFLEFELAIYSKDCNGGTNPDLTSERRLLVKKIIKFDLQSGATTHNKFVNYFNKFESAVNSAADKNVLRIDLKNQKSYIRGINAKTGTYVSLKDISNLADNILHGERLLMDTDALIINNFESNDLIACQLLNLNFVFDLEELIPRSIINMVYGTNITADMRVNMCNKQDGTTEQLLLKDFYSNYDYIPCKPSQAVFSEDGEIISDDQGINIFDLVCDNKNVGLLDKNKIMQNIIHWSLDGNNDYIFNFYTGFGGYTKSGENYHRSMLNYQDSIDVWTTKPSKYSAGWNWLSVECIKNPSQIKKFIGKYIKYPYTTLGLSWLKGIKFNTTIKIPYRCIVLHLQGTDTASYKKYLNILKAGLNNPKKIYEGKEGDIDVFYISPEDEIKYIIITDNTPEGMLHEKLLFKNFKDFLGQIKDNHKKDSEEYACIEEIYDWINGIIEPTTYTLPPLGYHRADSPSLKSTELNHYVMKDTLCSLVRYSGDLQPCFVDITENNYYTKIFIGSDELSNSDFVTYNSSGFRKLYPSIGYYPWTYHTPQLLDGVVYREQEDRVDGYEYRFFGNNQMIALKTNFVYNLLNVEVVGDKYIILGEKNTGDSSYSSVGEMIKNHVLKKIYNIPDNYDESDYLEYIYNKYNIVVDWKYNKNDDITICDYKITCILK